MKTTTLFRIALLPVLALLVFACKKEVLSSAPSDSSSSSLSSEAETSQRIIQQGPSMDWSVNIVVTKNDCDEQVFTLTGLNKNGQAIAAGDAEIELTITNANGIVGSPTTGSSPMTATTHLAPGTYSLAAKVTTGNSVRGQSSLAGVMVIACVGCPYKGLEDLTCADMPAEMYIGQVKYNHDQLCQLLAYNRGNHGYGALVRLAQAIMVAKVNGFTSQNGTVAAAEALIGSLNALNGADQASVTDNYGASEKGHVQDLVTCE